MDVETLVISRLCSIEGAPTHNISSRGCVTPRQIAVLQEQVGPVKDLDLDTDLDDILDGFPEISSEYKEKVKYALIHGHVHDDDWRGVSLTSFPRLGRCSP